MFKFKHLEVLELEMKIQGFVSAWEANFCLEVFDF